MKLSEHDQILSDKIVVSLSTEIRKAVQDFNWDKALTDSESDEFGECAWILTNLDCIDNGVPERYWYYDTFEDNNELFASWVEEHLGPRWGKIAENVEW